MALSLQFGWAVTARVGAEVDGGGVSEAGGVFVGGSVEVTKRGAVGVAFAFEMVMHPLRNKAANRIARSFLRIR